MINEIWVCLSPTWCRVFAGSNKHFSLMVNVCSDSRVASVVSLLYWTEVDLILFNPCVCVILNPFFFFQGRSAIFSSLFFSVLYFFLENCNRYIHFLWPCLPVFARWIWDSCATSLQLGRRVPSPRRPRSTTLSAPTRWMWVPLKRTGSPSRKAPNIR